MPQGESMPEFKRYSEVGEVAIENAEGIDSIITELDNIIADLNQKIVNTLHRVVGDISGRSQGDLGGISGGAHPLKPYFENFNKRNLVFLSLNQNMWIRYY